MGRSESAGIPGIADGKLKMNIESITIIESNGTDVVFLNTDLPLGCWPFTLKGLSLEFKVTQGGGKEYCDRHFSKIPITRICQSDN